MDGMSAFLSGVTLGLAITVPVGPMSVLCIQRALKCGVLVGFATGLGAATVLVVYTACVTLGLGPTLIGGLGNSHTALSVVSAGLLLWLSLRVLSRTVSLTDNVTEARGAVSSYCSGVACAFLNPLTPALLTAILPTIVAPEPDLASNMIAGVFTASVTWWLIVSGGVAILRSRLDVTVLNLINKVSGLALGAFGTMMALHAFEFGV